jgi:hypothetical protein
MKLSSKTSWSVLVAGIVAVTASCASLDIENPNAPDRTRALALPGDVVNLVGGAFLNWYHSTQDETPSVATSAMASTTSISWGNFGSRKYSSVPRVAFNNVATDADIDLVNTPWYYNYGALVSANLALGQVADPAVFNETNADLGKMVKAAATFIQGGALSNIALFFNQGFIVDETTDASTVGFSPRDAVRDAAIAKLDAAIALATASGTSFTLPNTYLNISGWTNVQLAEVANTQAARTLAYFPRTRAEMGAVDWAKVASYASKGISGGPAPFDPSIVGDANFWWDGMKLIGGDWDTWNRVNQRVVNEIDPAQPLTYPATGSPPAPSTPDARFDATPRGEIVVGASAKDFVYITYHVFNPARGRYHFSNVGHNRYSYHSYAWDSYALGTVPFLLRAENDLLWAEGLIRSNGSRTQAASLINKSRVTRGALPALTGTETSATGMRGLATLSGTDNNDILLRAIYYERDVELMNSSGVTPLYDGRRTDRFTIYSVSAANDLANTPRQFPVPAKELETLRKELYTIRGADSVAIGSATVAGGAQLAIGASANLAATSPASIGGRLVSAGDVVRIATAMLMASRPTFKSPF